VHSATYPIANNQRNTEASVPFDKKVRFIGVPGYSLSIEIGEANITGVFLKQIPAIYYFIKDIGNGGMGCYELERFYDTSFCFL
jgi:hypothetical protein